MSVCYRLVLDSVCRSNHHRLAVLALDRLQRADAEDWRKLFLKHRDPYLEGAKAPDEVFKDFKNHVLHVRDGDWGGAREAAREWYRRTVRALQAQDWAHAAYCAGVMSHYVVDPVQPFHTHQTEEENAIHRAVEWSLSKAFPELLLILTQDIGFPEVSVPDGEDWLEQMVRAGAIAANRHYETLIDHYDFAMGVKRPADGLDQEIKDVVAGLMGYAAVLLSRVLDRAIDEAKAGAPHVGLVLDTIGIVAATPVRALARRAAAVAEMDLVAAQYREFRKTGKVRDTLGEDDRVVRRLFAEEVLKVSLSSLDCQWPRETGTKAGQGADRRVTRKAKPGGPPVAKVASPSPVEAPKAAAKPVASPPVRLSREAAVVDAPSIGPKTANRLGLIGVKTVGDLLALAPDEAARRIKASHINAAVIKDWQAQAMLACSVPDLNGTQAQLLVGAGIASLEDLAGADIDTLMDALALFAATAEGDRLLRSTPVPERQRVSAWIETARNARAAA